MKKKIFKKPPVIEAMEPRLLFSDGLEGVLAQELSVETTTAVGTATLEQLLTESPETSESRAAEATRQEIIFVDTDTPDYQVLVDDLLANQDETRHFEVVLLNNDRDGITQVTEALGMFEGIDAVHIISHGDDGSIELGNSLLNFDTLKGNVDQVQAWGESFSADGDLLIYGCNLAASTNGEALVDGLAKLTGADVAASDDLTGSAEQGGDWELEYKTGTVETETALSTTAQDTWTGVLAVTTDSSSTGSTTGSSLTVSHTTSGTETLMIVGVSMDAQTGASVTGVTYNGSALSLVGTIQDTGSNVRVELWQMVAPADGTHDVVVSFSQSMAEGGIAGVMTFNGVDQTTPLGSFASNEGIGTTASVNVSATAGDMVFSTMGADGSTDDALNHGAGQTEYWETFQPGTEGAGSTKVATSTSETMSWTFLSNQWAIGAVSINQATPNQAPVNSIPELTANVLPGTVNGPATVASADFNGDGFMDIVAGTLLDPSSSSLSWYQNDGSENFTKNTITTAGMTADMIRDVVVADVDGDSYIDIVTVSQNDNQIAWWKNDGLGNFTQYVVSTTLESPRSVVTADFDGDGDMDIIAGGRPTSPSTAPTIIWFDNDGSEVFTTRIVATLSTIGQVTSLAVGNMDGDADLDIVAAGFSSDSFSWFEHQGAGTFATHTIDSGVSVDGAAFVSVADIDGDGDQDVATAAQYANAVSWYKNDGSGNFGAGPEWTITANGARSVYTADLENDGDVDIVAGAATDQTIIAHLNDGAATPGFSAQTISSTSAYPLDMSMGDIDGDGDMDLIEAAYSPDNQVRWYENHGGFQTTADTLEDTPLTFSAANGNLISISDPDAGGAAVQVTLTSTNGTTTLAGMTGLTFSAGDGTDDAVMTFTGTIADINVALNGLVFTSTTDFVGTANLQIDTNDLGNTGTGGALSDTDTVDIAVNPVNDAPTMTAWFNDAWESRKKLTINAASVAGDLTDFPVLITLNTDPELAAQALANGDDILFTAADGTTQLAHEIEFFDETTGELRVWVKTDLSGSVDTNIFMYFGNAASANQENIPGVWDNYVGVYHLSESPTGAPGELIDSSGSGNHATTEGSMDGADSVATTIGQGLAFDGTDDMIRIADSATLDSINDEATFSLWINFVNSADGDTQLVMSSSNRYSAIDGYEWASQNDGDHFFYPDAGLPDANYNLGLDPFTNGTWHHLAATMDFTTKEVKIYVDGSPMTFTIEGVPGNWTNLTSSDDMLWGGNPDRATRYFLGMMDEIRIADVARSQEWIQTEVNNQSAPGTFLSVGVTEAKRDSLTDINEDDFNSAGDTVLSIINSSGADRIMDSDSGALEGIAVTSVDDTNGQWQYDANADGTWIAFGAVSSTNAVLLDTGALVRFVPDADYNGNAGDLTFRAWDQTAGANGDTGADVSTNGGATAYSSETFAASLNVDPVNDAPVGIPTITGTPAEDQILTADTTGISDVDGLGAFSYQWYRDGVAIGGATSSTYTLNDADVGSTITVAASYTDGFGTNESVTSAGVGPIANINDAPVLDTVGTPTLTLINEGDINTSGDSVAAIIASAGGNPITDVDATPVEGMAITWADNSNGTWQYSTDGGGIWYDIGAASDTAAFLLTDDANNRIRFVPATNFNGTAQFNYRAWDSTDGNTNATAGVDVSTNGGTTAYSTATETANITIQPLQMVMYLSTSGDVSASGAPGLDSWDAGEVVAFGDPNVNLEPGTTDGTLYRFLDLRNFQTGAIEPAIDGIHQVSKNTTIGGNGGPSMDLFVGDILFAINSNSVQLTGSDLVEITTNKKSLFLFRPDTPGDYSAGTFSVVLDNFSTNEVEGISLVEVDTMVGDTLLTAGSFLYNPGNSRDIFLYTVNGAGAGTTSGVSEVLISGDHINMTSNSAKVSGLDLIETDVDVGATSLAAGNILVTLDGNDAGVGNNNLAVTSNDVFYLDVTTTTLGPLGLGTGTTVADAYLLFEGADLNFDTADEEITAISLDIKYGSGNEDPDISFPGSSVTYTENDPATVLDGGATVNDPDSFDFATGILRVDFSAGGTADDRLAISTSGQVAVVGNAVTYGGITIGTFIGGTSGSDPLVITFNSNANAAKVQAVLRNITYENVSEDPATAARNVRVVLTDGDGGTSNVEHKTINMVAVNDDPVLATNTGMTVAEGSTGTVITNLMLNEGDPDDSGAGLTYTVTAIPANGTLYRNAVALGINDTFTQADIDAGLITYDHDGSQNLSDSFTFSLADGGEDGATPLTGQVFSITVTNVDDPAVIAGDISYTGDEGDTGAGTLTATDADGLTDGTYFTVTAPATNGTAAIDPATGAWTFTPTDPNWFGTDNFTVTVTDDQGGTTTQVVNITLANVDDPAVIAGDISYTGDEGDTGAGTLTATDADGLTDGTYFTVTAPATNGTAAIDPATGAWTFTPTDPNWFGTDNFTVTVTDDQGGTTTQVVNITLANVDDPAVIAGDLSYTGDEGDTGAGTLTATDADGLTDGTYFTVTAPATNGTAAIDPATGAWTFTPTDPNWFGTDNFTVTVTDDQGGTTTQVVNITLANVDDPAVIAGDLSYTGDEGDTGAGTLTATDADGLTDGTYFTVTAPATNGTAAIDPATGAWTFTPTDPNWFGTDNFTVTVTDDQGGTTTQVVNITLANVDDPAVIAGDLSYTGDEGDTGAGTLTATDADGLTDGTYFTVTAPATNGTAAIDPATGAWTFTPTDPNWFGTDNFTVTVTDDQGGTTTQVVNITLANVDDPAVIAGDLSYTGDEGDTGAGTLTATDADGLTDGTYFTVTAPATNGTAAIDPATGAWTFTPTDPNWFGTDNFTVTVTDDQGGTTTQVVNITLANVDDPAVIAGDLSYTGDEGDTGAGTLTATDADGLTDGTYFTVTAPATNGTAAIDPATGAWTFTPTDPNWFGTDNFTVTVTDDQGGTTTQVVNITLANVDDPAVIAGDLSYTGDEGDTGAGTLTATDADGLTDGTYFTVTAPATNGTAAIDPATGAWTFTPTDPNWFGTDNFTVTVTDDQGGTTTQVVNITLANVDDPAVIAGDLSYTGDEGDTGAGTLTATDADGLTDGTYFTVTAPATNGTAAIDPATGAWTFTPTDPNWFGTDNFTVTVTDDQGGTTTQVVNITLANVDDPAVIAGDLSYTGDEGDTGAGTLTATDADGLTDGTYFTVTAPATNGTAAIDPATGAWTFTPTDPNWFGTDNFTVTVTDDQGGTTTQVVNITLANVDDPAVIAGDLSYTGDEGDTGAGTLTATDADGLTDGTYFTVTAPATNGTAAIDPATGAWTFTPTDPNWFGTDNFTVTVTDDQGGTTTQVVNITLANVDDPAVIAGDLSYTGDEGDTGAGTLTATDADGLTDGTYFTVTAPATNGTAAIDPATGAWTFTPTDPNWFGTDNFTVTVTDDQGGTTTQVVNITLANVDDPAVIAGDLSYTGDEGDTGAGTLTATDADGLTDGTYFTVTAPATNGTAAIDPATGAWTFTPTDPNWFGTDNFTVTVTDDQGGTTTQVVNITLANVDDPAVIAGDLSYTGDEGDTGAGTLTATDADGLTDGTYFTVTAPATNGTAAIDPATGAWTFTPTDPNWFGTDNFTVTVTDDQGGTTTQVVNITLANVDDPAVIAGDLSYTGDEGDTGAGTLTATDADGLTDGTYFTVTAPATNGTAAIDPATGAWTFTPTDPNWFGTDNFTVTVTDDQGGTTTQVVNITLANVDDPAVIAGDLSYTGDEGDTGAGTLTATDADGLTDGTYFTVTAPATNGTAAIDPATGAWTFTPTDPNWFGTDNFTVTVTDDQGGTTTQVVNITLANVDDPAVIAGDLSYTGDEGDTGAGTLTATDADGLTDGTYFTVTAPATNGTAAIDPATGAWTFTPTDPNWFGTDNFTVTVTDDQGGTTTQVVNITLANVDDPAVIAGDLSYTGDEGDTGAGTLTATDADGLTDGTYFTVTAPATNGTAAIDPATGAWTFTPTDPNWFGTDNFTVTVTDDQGGTTTQVVNITLANVDDPAVIAGDLSYTGDEGDTGAGTLTATDADGLTDGTYFTVTAPATNGTAAIDPATGAWTFTPTDPNWFGTDNFTVTVTDDQGGTTTQVVNITLANVDDPAVIAGDLSYTGDEGDTGAGTLTATDADGLTDGTYFTVTAPATNGTAAIDPATGAWTFTPTDPNWFGTDNFTVTVTDDQGGTTTQVVNITLANVDDPAVIAGDLSYTGDEGDTGAGTLTATDADGLTDGTYFTVTAPATNGTAAIDPATGAWTFTPTDPNWFGTDNFTVTVTDDQGGTTTQVVNITLANVDDPAVIAGDLSYTGDEGDTGAGTLTATDADGLTDGTYFTVTAPATNGTAAIDPATGAWTFTPTDPNWFGTDNFTVTVTDDQGGTTTQVVNITLANVDDPAVIAGDLSYTGDEGDTGAGTLTATDADGLTDGTYFTVTAPATNGTAAIDPATGAWTFTPTDPNWFGTDNFTVTVTDDQGGTTTQVVNITLANVDDPAVIAGDLSYTGDEGDTGAGTLTATDADGLTDGTYFTVTAPATNGTAAIDPATGAWTFTPTDPNWFGTDNFTVTVTDDQGGTTTQVVNITLANVDDPAVIAGDLSYTGDEGDTGAGTLTATDADGLTDGTYFTVTAPATNGTAAIDPATGAWTFTPTDPNWFGTDNFTVTVTDDQGGTTTQVVNITLANVDDPAVIAGDLSYTGDEGDTGAGTLTATDADGLTDGTYFTVTAPATNGTAAIDPATGAWTFTPTDPNWFGTDNFTVTVTDDQGGTTTQVVNITLANVDDPAVIAGDLSYTGDEGDTGAGTLTATDADGLTDGTYFTVTAPATNGTAAIDPATGAWTFTPTDPNWFGTDNFTVTVTDDQGGTTTQVVNITLANVDDPAVIAGDLSYTGDEGDTGAGTLTATDADGLTDGTYFTVTAPATNGTAAIDPATGAWTFTPTDPNWFGTDNFTVTVTDDQGGTTTQVVNITLANVDDPAVIAGDLSYTGDEGDTGAGTLTATDADGLTDGTYFTVTAPATNGTAAIDPATGAWTFTPTDPNWFGTDNFTVTVTDDQGGTTTQVVNITLANVDDPAVIAGDLSYTGDEGDTGAGTLTATDADGLTDGTYFTVTAPATNGTAAIDPATGAWTFTPTDPNWFGTDNFTVTVTDDQGGTTTQVVNITLANVDDPAVIAGDLSYTGDEGDTGAGTLTATDADGLTDGTYFTVTAPATNGTAAIDPATGAWTFTPTDPNWFGTDNFTVTVTDDQGGTTTQVVNITLANVDDPAVIAGDLSYTGDEGDTGAGTLTATDADGLTDGTYFTVTAPATNGTAAIDPATGAWTFTPTDPNWFGTDNFTVTVTDDQGGTTTQVVNITLANVDDPAVIAGDLSYTGDEGDTGAGTLTATDADGLTDGTYFTVTAPATNGTAAIDPATGAWTFTPTDPNWFGTDNFTVTVTDDQGGTTTQVVNITLANVDDPAVIAGDLSYTGDEGDTGAGTLTATDADGLTDGTYFTVTAPATNGTAAIDPATGAWTFTPTDPNWFGTDNFTVTVTDDQGGTTTQVVNITLANVDDPAVIAGDLSYTGDEGDTGAGTLTATDADGLTDGTYFTVTAPATNGTAAIDPATGAWTFTPTDPNWFGTDNFTVTVTDDQGGTTTQVVNITLANVDDPAVIAGDLSYTGDEGDTGAGTLTATDADGLTDGTYFTVTAPATNGTAAIDPATGAWTFTPTDPNWFGTDNFTVTVTDDQGGTTTQVVNITLANVNDAPVITTTNLNAAENQTGAGTVAATDADVPADTLTWTLAGTGADTGLFSIDAVTGALTFLVAPDFEAPGDADADNVYEVDVEVFDGTVTTTKSITVTVTNVNENGVSAISDADLATNTVLENAGASTPVGITAFATDSDATDTVSYSLDDDAGGRFAIDSATGIVTVNAALDYEANTSHSITVRADSTDGSFSTQSFTINVTDVDEFNINALIDNDATADAVDENSALGTPVGITAFADDLDGTDTVSYSLDDSAGDLFTIDTSTGVVTVNGALDAESATSHDITVRALSTDGSFSVKTFTIIINDVDEFDVGAVVDTDAAANTVAEDASVGTPVSITASATDNDVTDGITYSLDDSAGGRFAIDVATGVISVNAALDYETAISHTVTVRATSDDGSFSTQAFTINVSDVDEFDISAISDTDATADAVDENVVAGTTVGITAFASDGDGSNNTISYSLTDSAGGLFSVDANTGIVTVNGVLDAETATSYDITVRADSTDGSFATRTFTITVNDLDEAPTISAIADQTIDEDTSTGALAFTVGDPESAAGALSITASSSNQTIIPDANLVLGGSGASRTLTITPAPDQNGGPVTITVIVSDGVNSSSESFTVTVNPVNDAAVFGGVDTGSLSEDTGVVSGDITASNTLTVSDPDSGESGFIAGTLSGTYGTLSINAAGNWSYAADNSQAAIQGLGVTESLTDVVTITSLDGTTHDIAITITGANDVPVVNNDSYSLSSGGTLNMLAGGVLANDYDIDGDPLIATLITGPGNGTLTLNADGTFSYAADANFIGNDSFTYQVSDGNGGVATNTVTLTVNNLPETPPEDEGTVDDGTTLITTDTLSTAPDPASELLVISPSEINFTVNAVESLQEVTADTTKGDIKGVQDYYRDRLYEFQDDRFDRNHVGLAQHAFQKAYETVSDLHIKILEMLSEYRLEIETRHESNMPMMQLLSKYAGGVTLSLTAGILTWALRGGALAATMLSSMPIWKGFDPLPVLAAARKKYRKDADTTMEDVDDELIDEMFEGSEKSAGEVEDTHHD